VKSKRPFALTFFCLLGFFACFLGMMLVYSPAIQKSGKIYALYRSFSLAFLVVCYAGLWRMKRWAVGALAAVILVNQAVCWDFGTWDKGTLGPLLVLAVALAYLRRMD
jgi:hypothetical protein